MANCSIEEKNRLITRYTNIFKSSGIPVEEAKQLANERFNSINSTVYGSSNNTELFNNVLVDTQLSVNASNIDQIINTLNTTYGIQNASQRHIDYLTNLIKNNTSKIFNKIDEINLKLSKQGNEILGITDGKDIHIISNTASIGNNVQMSMLETFAHEIEHIKYQEYINDPNNKAEVDELEKLWEKTKEHLDEKYNGKGYRVFLNRDPNTGKVIYVNSIKDEIRAAKAQYNHIFNDAETQVVSIHPVTNKVRKASSYLHEFAASGVTNEALMKELDDIYVDIGVKLKGYTILDMLTYLRDIVTSWFASLLKNESDVKGTDTLNRIIAKLDESRDSMFTITRVTNELFTASNKFSSDMLNNKILDPLSEFAADYIVDLSNRDDINWVDDLKTTFALPIASLRDKNKRSIRYNKTVDLFLWSMQLTKRNAISELIREIHGYPREFIEKLNHTKRFIDQARLQVANTHKKMFLELFKNNLNRKDSIAIKKTVIDLDMSSLRLRYKDGEILGLLNSPDDVNTEIAVIEGIIENTFSKDVAGMYIQQSRSLGSYIATGKVTTDNNPNLNAYTISRAFGNKQKVITPVGTQLKLAEELIEVLTTLHGIKKSTTDTKRIAFNKLKDNTLAFTELLNFHESFKEQSLKRLFSNSKVSTIKGYSLDLYNPSVSIKVSNDIEDIDLLYSGYTRIEDPLQVDSSDNVDEQYLYINKRGGLATWVQQIVSMRNESIKGSSIKHRSSRTDNYGEFKSSLDLIKEIAAVKANSNTVTDKDYIAPNGGILVPVYNESGVITDYRYLMSKHVKDTVLEADNRLEEVFSKSIASIEDKVNSKTINKDTAKWLKKIYDKEFTDYSYKYIQLTANSEDEGIKETYIMLPEDFKRALIEEFGGEDKIYINEEYFNIVFGYRELTISKHKISLLVTSVLEELTQIAKNNIVIKSTVIVGNFISNIALNRLSGVPLEYQIRQMFVALRGIISYRADYNKLIELKSTLEAKRKYLTVDARIKMESDIARYEDRIARNPVTPLIDAGMFQTIAEDVDVEQDVWNYRNKFAIWAEPVLDILPGFTKDVAKYTYITNDTKAYEILLKSTQYSDFLSRYALYKFRTEEEGVSQEDALEEINDDFINYEVLTNKYLQAGNKLGVVWFSKYFLRIQRIILRKFRKYPDNFMTMLMFQQIFGGFSDITDSLAFFVKDPLSILSYPLIDSLDAATTLNGWELVFGRN